MIKVTMSRYIKFRREKVNLVNKSMRTNTAVCGKVRVGKVEVGPESPRDHCAMQSTNSRKIAQKSHKKLLYSSHPLSKLI